LIDYINENHGDKWHFKYSSPSDYIDALAAQKITWPTRYDDMMPYSTGGNDVWSGYFSSRPNLKSFVRTGSHVTHASNQLYAE